jgi:hypothetical protein
MDAELTGMGQEDPAFRIHYKDQWEHRVRVQFYGADYMNEQSRKKAEVRMSDPLEFDSYGFIIIRVAGYGPSGRGSKWFFILNDSSGEELHRGWGTDRTIDFEVNSSGTGVYSTCFNTIVVGREPVFPLLLRAVSPDDEPIDIVIEKS